MDLWENYLNIYSSLPQHCERSWGFLSEPINTISNIGFFISAYLIYKSLKINKFKSIPLKSFPLLIILIGVGSILYHAINNPYTLLADQIPIFIFIVYSLYILLCFITDNKILRYGIPLILIFLQFIILANIPLFVFGMPTRHVINFLFIIIFSFMIYQKLGKTTLEIIPVLLVYGIGIFARAFELIVCSVNGIGVHFFWHFCVALATYLTVKLLVRIYILKGNIS